MKRQRILGVALVAGLLGLGASPALAVTSPDGGSTAWRSGNTVTVRDTLADKKDVYANINSTAYNPLRNKSGYGAESTRTYSFSVTAIRACTEKPLAVDSCSNWV